MSDLELASLGRLSATHHFLDAMKYCNTSSWSSHRIRRDEMSLYSVLEVRTDDAVEPMAAQPQGNMAWLDRRVDEMRVRL